MLGHPYLASAVARLPLCEVDDSSACKTMATDGYHIYVNASFCDRLADEEIQFVLAHELLHCLLGHIDRRGHRDRAAWNAAIDYATNALLVELGWRMPRAGLFDEKYRGLTAEAIYDRLPRRPPGDVGQAFRPAKSRRKRAAEPKAGAGSGFDEHLEPGDALARLHQSDMPSSDERRRLRKALVASLASALPGSVAGRFQQEIEAAKTSEVPWQQLLARFVTGLRKSDYCWYPFNRKHLWRGYYLPALGVPGPEHLVVFVDTSGSMTDDILAQVAAELDRLRAVSECRLTVVQSDVKVQKVEIFEPYEASSLGKAKKVTTFYGRGGTDLRAPFEWLQRQEKAGRMTPAADAIIFLTDGFGPMPSKPPQWPVLWLITEHGLTEVPFGTATRIRA